MMWLVRTCMVKCETVTLQEMSAPKLFENKALDAKIREAAAIKRGEAVRTAVTAERAKKLPPYIIQMILKGLDVRLGNQSTK